MGKYRFFVSQWKHGFHTTRRILDLTIEAASFSDAYDTIAARYGASNINSCWPL